MKTHDDEHLVPRPTVPPILSCGLALWAGCAAGLALAAEGAGLPWAILAGCAGVAAAAGIAARRARESLSAASVALLFLALGVALSQAWYLSYEQRQGALLAQGGGAYLFQVVEDPQKGAYGFSVTARATPLDSQAGNRGFLVRVSYKQDVPRYGEEFIAHATFFAPSDMARASYVRKGIVARASVSEVRPAAPSAFGGVTALRDDFITRLGAVAVERGLDDSAVALVRAVVAGDRTDLFEDPLYHEVKVVGLAHMVAVSGAHLVIVTGFVRTILRAARLPRVASRVLQLSFLMAYLVMVGMPISCVRAAAMAAVSVLAPAARRRTSASSALGIVIVALVALDPPCALSLSFALSALSTLGILLFAPLFSSWVPVSSRRARSLFVDPVAMTAAALLSTFPLSIASFAQFPFVAFASNVACVPLVTIMCGVGTLSFVAMGAAALFELLIGIACAAACAFIGVTGALASIPGANVPLSIGLAPLALLAAVIAIGLWVFWPRPPAPRTLVAAAVSFVLVFTVVATLPRQGDEIIMLDVGQGDAFIVRSKGKTLLIDTGRETKRLYEALARNGVRSLDAVLVTHADDDHCGSLYDLKGVEPCEAVILASGTSASDAVKCRDLVQDAQALVGEDGVIEVGQGDVLTIGSFSCTVISPARLADEGGNADSLCVLVESDLDEDGTTEWRALFCGDAEADTLSRLVAEGRLGAVDVYKVGHHGSRAALDEPLAQALNPRIALVSVGADNSYGHPAPQTLAYLEEVGAEVYRTDRDGDVVCSLTTERLSVGTLR